MTIVFNAHKKQLAILVSTACLTMGSAFASNCGGATTNNVTVVSSDASTTCTLAEGESILIENHASLKQIHGGDWIEVDDPWLLGYKECKLPARSAANPLRRLATDFSLAALRKILPQILPRGPVTVVLEGLLIYLDAGQIKALLAVLQEILPGHRLLCDLVSRTVSECYGKNLAMTLMRLGTPLKPMDRPEAVLLDSGYRVVASRSVLETSVALGICPLPDFFIQTFCAREVRGNRVFLFESGAPPASSS